MSRTLLPSAINDPVLTPPSSVKRTKGKPMIVDISIGNNGEQVYKMRGARSSRKRIHQDTEKDEQPPKRRTPMRHTRGEITPRTLKQHGRTGIIPHSPTSGSPSADDGNKWSEDVEEAFEEALRMIPKNGLTKIKISGKSCGRNELISDYILQRTGKVRSRKQVSSHIQVIKNLRKNTDLIELINNGPSDLAAIKRFDEVFTEISFKKSLGNAGPANSTSNAIPESKPSTPLSMIKRSSRKGTLQGKKKSPRATIHRNVGLSLKTFEMAYYDFEHPSKSHTYTRRSSSRLDKALRLKPDASIENRFPNLNDYLLDGVTQDEQVPILHNLVTFNLPNPQLELKGEHETKLQIELKDIASEDEKFGVITTIYSFGNEVIKLVDDAEIIKSDSSTENTEGLKNVSLEVKFAKDFWVAFFSSVENNVHQDRVKAETQKTIAVKAITMKQVIFNKKRASGFAKYDIRSILLWEFTRSQSSSDTSSRRLYLPYTERKEIKFLSKLTEPVKEGSLEISSEVQQQTLEHPYQRDNEESESELDEESEDEEPTTELEELYQNPVQHFCYKEHQFPPFLETDLQKEDEVSKFQESPKVKLEESDNTLSSDSTLRLDEELVEQTSVNHINTTTTNTQFLRTSSIPYLPQEQHYTQQHQLRRMQSSPTPSSWTLQPTLSWPSSTTSTISTDGFNDDLANWDQNALGFNPTLTPSYLHLDRNISLKVEPEFQTTGELFQQW